MQQISQKQLDQYKLFFPKDARLQALTVEELIANTDGGIADWDKLPHWSSALEASVWKCSEGIGFVIFDCVCLFLGADGLRAGATEAEAEAIAEAAEPVLSKM